MAVWTSFPLSFFFNRISFRIRRHGFSLCLSHRSIEIVSSRKKSPSSNTRELSFPRAIIFPLVDGCSRVDNRWTLKIRSIEFIITKVAVPATTRMERITHFTYWTHAWLTRFAFRETRRWAPVTNACHNTIPKLSTCARVETHISQR